MILERENWAKLCFFSTNAFILLKTIENVSLLQLVINDLGELQISIFYSNRFDSSSMNP